MKNGQRKNNNFDTKSRIRKLVNDGCLSIHRPYLEPWTAQLARDIQVQVCQTHHDEQLKTVNRLAFSILFGMTSTSIARLETPRLRLRTWRADDLDRFAEINAHPDVMAYFPAPLSKEETNAMIGRLQAHQAEHGFCFWAVDHRADDTLIGMIGLNRPNMETWFTPCVEIGWRLHPAFWGRGLAAEGALACLDFAWEELGLQEVVSFTASINLPSQGVMKKIGMHPDGAFDHPVLPEGHRLQRHVLYRISRPARADKDQE